MISSRSSNFKVRLMWTDVSPVQSPRCSWDIGSSHRVRSPSPVASPEGKFAQEVGQPSPSVAPAYVGDPFAEDGAVDQRVLPQRHADGRTIERKLHDRLAGNKRDLRNRQRLNAMVRISEDRVLQIDNLALHVDRKYLTAPGAHDFMTERET